MDNEKTNGDVNPILKKITDDFVQKIMSIDQNQIGVYAILRKLYKVAGMGDLGIILEIAENQPVKADVLVSNLEPIVSKSTIYRKLAFFAKIKLIYKDINGYWRLEKDLKSLAILAEIFTHKPE